MSSENIDIDDDLKPPPDIRYTHQQLSSMTLGELQQLCKDKSLSKKGSMTVLIDRYLVAQANGFSTKRAPTQEEMQKMKRAADSRHYKATSTTMAPKTKKAANTSNNPYLTPGKVKFSYKVDANGNVVETRDAMSKKGADTDIRYDDLCQGCGCYQRSQIWHTCSDCERLSCHECADAGYNSMCRNCSGYKEDLMIAHYNRAYQHTEGYLYRAESNAEKKERTMEDSGPPYWGPKTSVEGSRSVTLKKKQFICDGTLLLHSRKSWAESPYTHRESHEVRVSSPVETVCYDEKIEDLTPFDCLVYWETKREQCMSCFKADQKFRQWACGNPNAP